MEIEQLLLDRIRHDFTEEGFEVIFLRLDLLHDAASAGCLTTITSLSADQVKGWLEELIFTAKETIQELEND